MVKDKQKTCCFTGHRLIPHGERALVRARLVHAVSDLYREGYRHFVAGGALGFDAMAAEVVLSFRRHYPDMTLTLVLPCADQAARWKSEEKAVYEAQKQAADEVICLTERYYDGCMQKRNLAMVDMSSACIAYLSHPYSGAGQTVRMAERAGLRVINTHAQKDT